MGHYPQRLTLFSILAPTRTLHPIVPHLQLHEAHQQPHKQLTINT
jgi:hypothetical protein